RNLPAGRPQPRHAAGQRLRHHAGGAGADRGVGRGGAQVSALLVRGRLLSFRTRPEGLDDRASYIYEEDGGLLLRGGKIVAWADLTAVSRDAGEVARVVDRRPNLILPGFIDARVHMPQMQVIASYGAELLEWLNSYTFPEETKFSAAQHGRRIARL